MFAAAAAALALAFGVPVQCPDATVYRATLAQDVVLADGNAAFFFYPTGTVWLSPIVCAELAYLQAGKVPVRRGFAHVGFSVFVFAHELAHAAGFVDEAEADCQAAASFFEVAGRLGVPLWEARWLAWWSAPVDGYFPEVSGGCFSPLADPMWPFRE